MEEEGGCNRRDWMRAQVHQPREQQFVVVLQE